MNNVKETYLKSQEVAEMLQISVRTLDRMVQRGELTAEYVTPRIKRYRLSAIEELMSRGGKK